MKYLCKILLYLMTFIFSTQSFSYFDTAPNSKGPASMNGIEFKKYSNFTKKWKLVTFRYREDSGELRAIYANDIAWKGLTKLKPDYADGAMFAKVAFLTEQDPAFPSSKQPLSIMRYQFMLKNKIKFKETDGWGYALFNSKGELFSGDLKQNSLACAACHRVVPERDYVFSRPMQLDPNAPPFPQFPNSKNSAFKFSSKKISFFEGSFIAHLKQYNSDILFLEGDIQKHGFSGTLSEVIPLLVEQAKKSSLATTLFLNNQNYTLVTPADSATCKTNPTQLAFHILIIFNGKPVSDTDICQ